MWGGLIHRTHHITRPLLGDEQVTHAHTLRYEAADEEDRNRNQSPEMNICAGHRALLKHFSVPGRRGPERQISELFDHCLSGKENK